MMLQVDGDDDPGDPDDGDADLHQVAIPPVLLQDIMAEARNYMTLYNRNPSKFLLSQKLVKQKRSHEKGLRKKMASGIVGLTRPRFGKRSDVRHILLQRQGDHQAKLGNSLALFPLTYIARNIGMYRNNQKTSSPRFGKRSLHGPSHVLKFLKREQNEVLPKLMLLPSAMYQDNNANKETETEDLILKSEDDGRLYSREEGNSSLFLVHEEQD